MRLLDAPTAEDIASLRAACAKQYGRAVDDVEVIHAPYRICPIGAHIDHQRGPVSALAVDHGILLAYVPDDQIRISSDGYLSDITIPLTLSVERAFDWADYARGAVNALAAQHQLQRGAAFVIRGRLSEAGISSSAAVGLGYLLALSRVNDIKVTDAELIEYDRMIENEFLGLKNGVLDQSAITLARAGALTIIDCDNGTFEHIEQETPFEFLAVYSGVREPLVNSGKFNNRVEECLQAGAALQQLLTGNDAPPQQLGLTSHDDWERLESLLEPHLRRRARHFFTESARVRQGGIAWAASDHAAFGELMRASARSSIENYETGSDEMIRLLEILTEAEGVIGARFSGAGFRGCAVALIEPGAAQSVADTTERAYVRDLPQFENQMWAIHSRAGDGIRVR